MQVSFVYFFFCFFFFPFFFGGAFLARTFWEKNLDSKRSVYFEWPYMILLKSLAEEVPFLMKSALQLCYVEQKISFSVLSGSL